MNKGQSIQPESRPTRAVPRTRASCTGAGALPPNSPRRRPPQSPTGCPRAEASHKRSRPNREHPAAAAWTTRAIVRGDARPSRRSFCRLRTWQRRETARSPRSRPGGPQTRVACRAPPVQLLRTGDARERSVTDKIGDAAKRVVPGRTRRGRRRCLLPEASRAPPGARARDGARRPCGSARASRRPDRRALAF